MDHPRRKPLSIGGASEHSPQRLDEGPKPGDQACEVGELASQRPNFLAGDGPPPENRLEELEDFLNL
eukprot:8640488-Alexandrium_andersonii.AAC.1